MFSKTSHVPQWIADLRGRKMLDANDAALKFWRMTREQFLSSRFDEFFHPEEMTRWENFISLNRWGESGPWKCTHGDRTIFYCTVRWQMIDYDGKPCAVVMAVRAGDSIATMADLNSDQSQSAGAVAE